MVGGYRIKEDDDRDDLEADLDYHTGYDTNTATLTFGEPNKE
jgi:hypothetical protein